jgi:hypothetical protein
MKLFSHMTVLFGRETIRNPATAAFMPMMIEEISGGRMTWQEALDQPEMAAGLAGGAFPMSFRGAQAASRELMQEHQVFEGDESQDISGRSEEAGEMAQREIALAERWLSAQMRAEGYVAFHNEIHARQFITRKIREFFNVYRRRT